ncbi:MAG: glutamine synthetase beta-grasp domain-containing protein [Planctomycetota bacterium]|jgi:glutamine synthetase
MSEKTNDPLEKNPIVRATGKQHSDWERRDLLKYISEKNIERVNMRYVSLDGRLKELKIPVAGKKLLDRMLASGERIDGSNPFRGVVDPGESDLYLVPVYRTAFQNPFDEKALDIICRLYTAEGELFADSPGSVVCRAQEKLKEKTGIELHALGELEFYVIHNMRNAFFRGRAQGGYHETYPFVIGAKIDSQILATMAKIYGNIKYAHSEVGYINNLTSDLDELRGMDLEQHEIEFLPAPIEDMADQLLVAKWVIRNIAANNGVGVTFAPKLDEGDAGSGLHIHISAVRDGENIIMEEGELTDEAIRIIGGILKLSPSLTAFGNSVSSAYLRLVPHQEAPTRITWGSRNRSVLVRVPLSWEQEELQNLASKANPNQSERVKASDDRATVEFRAPDGSADVHLLIAGLGVAARVGLTWDESREYAQERHVVGNVFDRPEFAEKLLALPDSCFKSAQELHKQRAEYEADGVFTKKVIDYVIGELKKEDDKDLNKRLAQLSNKDRLSEARKIMHRVMHRH